MLAALSYFIVFRVSTKMNPGYQFHATRATLALRLQMKQYGDAISRQTHSTILIICSHDGHVLLLLLTIAANRQMAYCRGKSTLGHLWP